MRLSQVYDHEPWMALQHVIAEAAVRWAIPRLWTSTMGTDGVRYGSYKSVSANMLVGRTYLIEWADDTIAIHFLDAVYDCKLHQTVRIPPD